MSPWCVWEAKNGNVLLLTRTARQTKKCVHEVYLARRHTHSIGADTCWNNHRLVDCFILLLFCVFIFFFSARAKKKRKMRFNQFSASIWAVCAQVNCLPSSTFIRVLPFITIMAHHIKRLLIHSVWEFTFLLAF